MVPNGGWIEHYFNLFPDCGSGTTEALCLAALLAVLLSVAGSWYGKKRPHLKAGD